MTGAYQQVVVVFKRYQQEFVTIQAVSKRWFGGKGESHAGCRMIECQFAGMEHHRVTVFTGTVEAVTDYGMT